MALHLWLVKTGEPWPSDGQHVRLLRTGVMARQYANLGDDVVWFNEIFDHFSRRQMPQRLEFTKPAQNLEIVGLNGRGYRRSVSLSRMLHHADVARDFRARIDSFPPPAAILAALTPLELSREAVRYGRANGVPVVVDVRDLWPEVWIDLVPRAARPLARLAVRPYFAMLREIVDRSAALCGISEAAVNWALAHGSRARNSFDGALPLAYEPPELSEDELRSAGEFWSAKGIARDERILTICFFGSLSHRIELDTMFQAARDMPEDLRARVRFVICGRGEAESKVSKAARDSGNVHFAGWVNAAQIEALKRRADIGLLPYPSTMDFTRSLPNKVFDYLSGGLPLLTCLKGAVAALVAEERCGWMYQNRDPASLTNTIRQLANDRQLVAEAANRARHAAGRFTASSIYGHFRQRLERICT